MPRRSALIFWVTALTLLIVDQAVKAWTRQEFHIGEAHPLWPGVFELTLTYNKGIAFGMAQGMGVWLAPVAVGIAIVAGVYSARNPQERALIHVCMGLLASGAIGNLIDRVWLGQVTDMFWFRLIDFPVFNVADSCITIATILLSLTWWKDAPKPAPSAQSSPVSETPPPASE
ncbi:MAG: signal peptidase II [Fimbriimonas sp.]